MKQKNGCLSKFIFLLLISVLSILVGLTFLEYDERFSDGRQFIQLRDFLRKTSISNEKKFMGSVKSDSPQTAVPSINNKQANHPKNDNVSLDDANSVKSKMDDKTNKIPEKSKHSSSSEKSEISDVKSDINIKKTFDEKVKDIEEQIEPKLRDSSDDYHKASNNKGEKHTNDDSQLHDTNSDENNINTHLKNEINLSGLYQDIENLADEIHELDPENVKIKELEPYFSTIEQQLESGQVKGLVSQLTNIQTVLLDIMKNLQRERNNISRSKETTKGKEYSENGKVPVDEVVPDPIYIRPLGEENNESKPPTDTKSESEKSNIDKVPSTENTSSPKSAKNPEMNKKSSNDMNGVQDEKFTHSGRASDNFKSTKENSNTKSASKSIPVVENANKLVKESNTASKDNFTPSKSPKPVQKKSNDDVLDKQGKQKTTSPKHEEGKEEKSKQDRVVENKNKDVTESNTASKYNPTSSAPPKPVQEESNEDKPGKGKSASPEHDSKLKSAKENVKTKSTSKQDPVIENTNKVVKETSTPSKNDPAPSASPKPVQEKSNGDAQDEQGQTISPEREKLKVTEERASKKSAPKQDRVEENTKKDEKKSSTVSK